MTRLALQPIPYQGSKRNIAEQIMAKATPPSKRLIEPFAGSAAVTLYSACHKIANKFQINDPYKPLMDLWRIIIEDHERCVSEYEALWTSQLETPGDRYLQIRREFNVDNDPVKLLFLMARCAKNAVRFNSSGHFNQSPDNRRLGRKPAAMKKHLFTTSFLLKNKITFMNTDYEEVLAIATRHDLVYMDPPYQGTSSGKNPRYHQGLDLARFIENLERLKSRKIPFILSFDGQLGDKQYGKLLPKYLNLQHISINAGRSAQATLNGKAEITIESLYISNDHHLPSTVCPALVAA